MYVRAGTERFGELILVPHAWRFPGMHDRLGGQRLGKECNCHCLCKEEVVVVMGASSVRVFVLGLPRGGCVAVGIFYHSA